MASVATDNFESYSDNDDLGSQSNWSDVSGTWDIQAGTGDKRARSSAGGETCCRWSGDSFDDDQYAQIVLDNNATGYHGVAVRAATGAVTYYGFYCASGDAGYLFKQVAGSWTQMGSNTTVPANGSVVYLEADGESVTAEDDGVELESQTDSAISSGYAGLSGYDAGNVSDGNADDWEGGNLAAAAAEDYIVSVIMHHRMNLGFS